MTRNEDRKARGYDWRDGPDVEPPLVLLSFMQPLFYALVLGAPLALLYGLWEWVL